MPPPLYGSGLLQAQSHDVQLRMTHSSRRILSLNLTSFRCSPHLPSLPPPCQDPEPAVRPLLMTKLVKKFREGHVPLSYVAMLPLLAADDATDSHLLTEVRGWEGRGDKGGVGASNLEAWPNCVRGEVGMRERGRKRSVEREMPGRLSRRFVYEGKPALALW